MDQQFKRILLWVMCGCLLSACSPFAPLKQKPIATYMLDVPLGKMAKGAATNSVLYVTDPAASAGFDTDKIAYVAEPYQLTYFSYNRWIDTPASMLKPLIVDALQSTGRFHAVVSAPYTGDSTYRLDTTVIRLQQNFILTPSVEELVVRAQLIHSDTQKVMAVKLISVATPASANTPYAGVVAANKIVSDFLDCLAEFVVDNT